MNREKHWCRSDLKREKTASPTGENTSAEYLGILKTTVTVITSAWQILLDYYSTQRAAYKDGPPRFLSHFSLRFDRGYDTMQKKPQRRSAVPEEGSLY